MCLDLVLETLAVILVSDFRNSRLGHDVESEAGVCMHTYYGESV